MYVCISISLVLGEVDEATREVFGLTLDERQWASVPAIANCVAYQGFDPLRVLAEFMRRGVTQPSETYKTVTIGDSTMEVCEGTEPKSDLLFLLTVFITRGNNVAKILLKCDTAVRDIISRKCSQYGISTSDKQRAGPLGPSVITLARLSQAFAPATA
ncbi:unnamed protein product [Euphydryas editha]|uniref:Uncharacterized protein n=1 Tax=Euphydryas editha TaxID=104508 RepID=A0AAU9TNS0_EUPED|nr:unnamed protein product [Euphydryas editha]